MTKPFCVPPCPEVMSSLYMEYLRSDSKKEMSFGRYLDFIGYINPADNVIGMDDATIFKLRNGQVERIDIPAQAIQGDLNVIVLLVDFSDREGTLPAEHYHDMLFSSGSHPSGSMRDYYYEVTRGKVNVVGSVHGWLRMPQPYSYYTNGKSGFDEYPNNAQKMAEDAVATALQNDIAFDASLDKLNQGIVTALFIIHAGFGAEEMHRSISGNEIWSHKWNLNSPIRISTKLTASIYLTVPVNCKVGVCAHELGHLAFQWQDFYDPNYDEDGNEWDGAGVWDLMAGGSWNNGGSSPAHPAGLHKLQHQWVETVTVQTSQHLVIKPFTHPDHTIFKIVSPQFDDRQYLVLENRIRRGFDLFLPGEGLLVWRIDERAEMEQSTLPGMLLIQADGKHDLETPNDGNAGDAGDPFPGVSRRTELSDSGAISTSFPNAARSGITLKNITHNSDNGEISLDVFID